MRMWVILFWLTITTVFIGVSAHAQDKQIEVNSVLQIIQKISALTSVTPPLTDAEMYKTISDYIAELHSSEALEKCAILSWHIGYPGTAGDEHFDRFFDSAYGICVQKLALIKGTDAASALGEIKRWTLYDGSNALELDEYIAKQKSLK